MALWYAYPVDDYRHVMLALAIKNPREPIWQTRKIISIKSSYSLKQLRPFQEPGGRIHLMYVTLKETYWNVFPVN